MTDKEKEVLTENFLIKFRQRKTRSVQGRLTEMLLDEDNNNSLSRDDDPSTDLMGIQEQEPD